MITAGLWQGYFEMRRKIRLLEGQAKYRHLKNWPVKGRRGRCLSVWGPEPHTHPLPFHIVYVYTVYLFTQGRGRGRVEPERRTEGQQGRGQITKLSWNTNMAECTQEIGHLQSINSSKHLPQSPFTGKKIFLDDDISHLTSMSPIFLRCNHIYVSLTRIVMTAPNDRIV